MSLLQRLKGLLTLEPAVAAWVASGGLAAILITALHVNPVVAASIATIVSGAATIYTAVTARPIAVSMLVGALATGATALAGFGLHLSPDAIAAGAAILSTVLGLVFRANLTPAVKLKQPKPGADGVYRAAEAVTR
jgi:hypothetical protein